MRWLLGSFFWLAMKQCSGQPAVKPDTVCQLPAIINESSGLWVEHPNQFWTHNDSGDGPNLFAFDSAGTLVRQIAIAGATNVDWEDLAYDPGGRLFIGDFGNNSQNRTDLKVYILPWPVDTTNPATGVLRYPYSDQVSFPASANFDMEGFFFWNDSLYLFSKNKITNTTGYSKLYRLPADTGTFMAELLDSIHTGSPVTAADISPSGKRVALLCYGKFLLFETGGNMDIAQWQRRDFAIPLSQTEAIAFWGEDTLYLTDEQGKLYRISLPDLPAGRNVRDSSRGMHLWPNPASGHAWLGLPADISLPCTVSVYGLNGQPIYQQTIESPTTLLSFPDCPAGYYLVQLQSEEGLWQIPIVLVE